MADVQPGSGRSRKRTRSPGPPRCRASSAGLLKPTPRTGPQRKGTCADGSDPSGNTGRHATAKADLELGWGGVRQALGSLRGYRGGESAAMLQYDAKFELSCNSQAHLRHARNPKVQALASSASCKSASLICHQPCCGGFGGGECSVRVREDHARERGHRGHQGAGRQVQGS